MAFQKIIVFLQQNCEYVLKRKQMEKMKFFCIQVLTTMCCMALLTACSSDDFDEPIPSKMDTSVWPLTGNMDTLTYRAGDDFFMYCNGNFWKNADLEGGDFKGYLGTEVDNYIKKLVSQTDIPHEKQLKDLAEAVKENPLTEEEMEGYMAPVMEVINSASTQEECIRLFARLYKMGYNKTIYISCNVEDGMFKPMMSPVFYYINNDEEEDSLALAPPQPTLKQLIDHPELAEAYHHLANTRNDGNDVINILASELGLNPQDLLVSDEGVADFATYMNASVEEIKADLAYMVLMVDQPYMNPELLAESNEYFGEASPGEKFEAWVNDIFNDCRYTASYAFATKYITQQMIEDVENKCEELRSVFSRRIADLDWMSNTTKNRAIEKLDLMNVNVGYPKNWVMEAMVDFSSCQTLVEAARMARKADLALMLSFLGKDIKTHGFNALLQAFRSQIDLRTVNAFYVSVLNAINILPAFMMPPLYATENHDAVNYATFYVIGHEITHGFDSNGANFDGLGNYRNWWTVQDKMDFEERYQLLIDCYDRLEMMPWDRDYAGKYCPGKQTLTENIADLGGFEIAHQAFIEKCQREGYYGVELDKQERKFYQAYANFWRAKYLNTYVNYWMFTAKDSHAIERERINGVVMNTDRWYELYNVQWGDNLYLRPENRSHIW